MTDDLRRRLLSGGLSSLALGTLLGSGLLRPSRVLAAEWQRAAFSARTIGEALKAYSPVAPGETRDIVISAPEIAENGAKVPVEISCNLPGTKSLAVFADRNPTPLCATLDFAANVLPYVRLELKIAESSRLRVVARTADGKTHIAFREIKVTLGGCGN